MGKKVTHRIPLYGAPLQKGQKSGAPYTPIRCAFAFLVTPKLPAKRGEVIN